MTYTVSESGEVDACIDYDLPCPKCAYNLKGLPAARCPECGYTLSAPELIASEIPWTRRRAHGRIRTYCQTVWMVTFRSRQVRAETDRHVQYDDAQRFRWVTVMVVYLPWLVCVGVLGVLALNMFGFGAVWRPAATVAVPQICLLLFLAAATGMPSYFFHPRYLPIEMQDRGIALSYYTCGVLAWLLPAYVLAIVAAIVTRLFSSDGARFIGLVIIGGTGFLVALHWAVFVRKLGNHILGPGRAWTTTWLLISLWLLLAVGFFVVLPGMIFCMSLMASSIG